MVKISIALQFRTPFNDRKNTSPRDSSSLRAIVIVPLNEHCIIELKEAGWEKRRIARHMGRTDAAIRRCWQEWVENGRFQHYDGSGRPRATADREFRLIVR
ncbi:HTH_Tnp_Tc3_2 domain-containing protein [Trichonephila clavipes]|nr:HTH_Tnp_Tc3_2 domain-containing protein [Trichonephila clavipes]